MAAVFTVAILLLGLNQKHFYSCFYFIKKVYR